MCSVIRSSLLAVALLLSWTGRSDSRGQERDEGGATPGWWSRPDTAWGWLPRAFHRTARSS